MIIKRTCGQIGQISDIAVSAGIEVNGAANTVFRCKGQFFRFSVNIVFNGILEFIVHFFAFSVHQLDAVIVKGVMAC